MVDRPLSAIGFFSNRRTGPFMKSKAAVAWEAGKPLEIEELDVAAPRVRRGAD